MGGVREGGGDGGACERGKKTLAVESIICYHGNSDDVSGWRCTFNHVLCLPAQSTLNGCFSGNVPFGLAEKGLSHLIYE